MSFDNIINLLQQQNVSWAQVESNLQKKNTDSATIKQVQSLFNSLDSDRDGSISSNEWAVADKYLKELDTDGNNIISEEEIASSQENNMFKAFDTKTTNTFLNALSVDEQPDEPIPTQLTPPESTPEEGQGGATLDKEKFEFDEKGNLITYPKNGETFKKTAERLGFIPGSLEYDEFVKANPSASRRKWFKVGDKVKIPESIQNKVNKEGLIGKDEGMEEVQKYSDSHPVAPSKPTSTGPSSSPSKPSSTAVEGSNLPKGVRDRIASLRQSGDNFAVTKDKSGNYTVDVSNGAYMRKSGLGEIIIKYDSAGNMISQTNKYNNGKTIETTYKGGKKTKVLTNEAPKAYQDMAAKIKKKYGGNIRIEYNSKIKKYVMVQTNIPNSNIKEKRIVVDEKAWQEEMSSSDAAIKGAKDAWDTFKVTSPSTWKKSYDAAMRNKNSSVKLEDHFLSETTTYKDGKKTQSIYKEGKIKTQKTVRTSSSQKTEGTDLTGKKETIHTATDISFSMPANAPQNAKIFANSLTDNKAALMRQLNIDSDTYNELAQTAIGIAGKETNFGESTGRQLVKDTLRLRSDSVAWVQDKFGLDNTSTVSDWSQGITQLKFTLHMKDPAIKKDMEAMGITNELQLQDPEVSAKATMIVLAHLNKRLGTEKYQNGISAAQGTEVRYEGWEMGSDGVAKKAGKTVPWKNEITKQDALCALWNGGEAASLINGTFKPQGWEYTREVRKYTNKYKLNESENSRAAALEKEEATRPMADASKNNGDIGGVVFLPAMYTDKSKHTNTVTEINQLKEILTKNGIDVNLRNQLIGALRNGELGFDFGLRKSEMEALTNSDIKLILKHLNKLKGQVNVHSGINTTDGINTQEASLLRSNYAKAVGKAEDAFRREYLNNHSKVYNASDNNQKVLKETSTTSSSSSYVNSNGERRGYKHEHARGVNQNTSAGSISPQAKTLAGAAHDVVMQNPNNSTSGNCLTGVKSAMKAAGIDVSSMAEYGSTPKYIKNWFASHPEMFTPVEYVSTGNGTARAINASDLSSLPAGYIVIWEPEAGGDYASQAGHIAITNGYGQGYSDTTDNLGWGAYNNNKADSGKGEHGKFVVYKLSDNWEVGSDGKLKLKN